MKKTIIKGICHTLILLIALITSIIVNFYNEVKSISPEDREKQPKDLPS